MSNVDEVRAVSETRSPIFCALECSSTREISDQALELFDAAVVEVILGGILVGYEPLEQGLVADEHVDEVLPKVLGLELLPAEIEEESSADRELGGADL